MHFAFSKPASLHLYVGVNKIISALNIIFDLRLDLGLYIAGCIVHLYMTEIIR